MQNLRQVRPTPAGDLRKRNIRLGEILTSAGYLDKAALRSALLRRHSVDAPLGQILRKNGLVSDELIVDALSVQWDLPRVDVKRIAPEPNVLLGINLKRCLEIGCMPHRNRNGITTLVLSDPEQRHAAVRACGLDPARTTLALAPRQDILDVLSFLFTDKLEHRARHYCPEDVSCRGWSGGRFIATSVLVAGMLGAAAFLAPIFTLWAVFGWILIFNLAAAVLRGAALIGRLRSRKAVPLPKTIAKFSDHRERPVISLLVPLHKEDLVLPALTTHLAAIDYPRELLDVKLLVEEHDDITLNAIKKLPITGAFDVLKIPDNALKTKPRALNYALTYCLGQIVGVLDAEDRPDPDQLNQVVAHLWNAPPDVACVQGRLDFYNSRNNWMSRCFTLEYAIWFNVLLRGMRKLDLPIPLGGTSVYFRRNILENLGAWDAHNVTEDADLGMRLARKGFKTEILPSTTMEEANGRFIPWIKQRSRWLKGYLITWAVHMRNPRALYRDLGLKSFLAFQVIFLGGVTSYLSAPLLLTLWMGAFGFNFTSAVGGTDTMWFAATASMIFGQIVMLAISVLACWEPSKRHLLKWIITAPVYWQIGAFATLKAVAEMFYKPFFWDKTTHGDQSDQTTSKLTSPSGPIDSVIRPV